MRRRPTEKDWARFRECCTRVRRLEDEAYSREITLHPEIYTILLYGPELLFPHLEKLRLDVVHLRAPFIAPSVVDLTLLLTGKLSDAATNVQTLRVDGDRRVQGMIEHVARVCHELPKLQTLVLSCHAADSSVFRALSSLPVLRSIRIAEYCPSETRRSRVKGALTVTSPAELREGSFPKLKEIGLIGRSGPLLSRFVLGSNFPSASLVQLWFLAPGFGSSLWKPRHVRSLLEDLSRVCVNLEALTIRLADLRCGQHVPLIDVDALSFADIRGFLLFPRLRSFAIDHNVPLWLVDADVKAIATGAGKLKSLSLNPFPPARRYGPNYPHVSIHCITEFARCCPDLESLALQVDGSGERFTIDASLPRFRSLRTFFVGWSLLSVYSTGGQRVEKLAGVAQFLAKVLSRQTALKTVSDYAGMAPVDIVSAEMERLDMLQIRNRAEVERNDSGWKTVWAMVKFLQETEGGNVTGLDAAT